MSKVNIRLKRVIGQINGIIKMIEEEQDCEKIIIQFQATKAALDSAFAKNLERNLAMCLKNKGSKTQKKILKLISKK